MRLELQFLGTWPERDGHHITRETKGGCFGNWEVQEMWEVPEILGLSTEIQDKVLVENASFVWVDKHAFKCFRYRPRFSRGGLSIGSLPLLLVSSQHFDSLTGSFSQRREGGASPHDEEVSRRKLLQQSVADSGKSIPL